MRILRAHHVAVHTPDLARLRAFYVETLGLPVVGGFPEHGILFVLAGDLIVELIEDTSLGDAGEPAAGREAADARSGEVDGATRRAGWDHLALEVEDVDAAYAELTALGVVGRSPPGSFPPAAPAYRIAFLADPDGNLLELLQPLTEGSPGTRAARAGDRPS